MVDFMAMTRLSGVTRCHAALLHSAEIWYQSLSHCRLGPSQGKLKREAGESQVAEQASAVEAVRAENAAALAKLAENEARARALRDAVRDLRAAHDAQVTP